MEHRFSCTNDGSQPEMRKSVGLDKIVDFAAVLGVAVEKRGDAIRAVQDVAAESWAWVGSGHVVHRGPIITRPSPQPHG